MAAKVTICITTDHKADSSAGKTVFRLDESIVSIKKQHFRITKQLRMNRLDSKRKEVKYLILPNLEVKVVNKG